MTSHNSVKGKENSSEKTEEEAPKSKKKGCLLGCLAAIVVAVLLVVGLSVFGYRNRYRFIPFVMDKMDIEVSAVMQHVGTEVESNLPSEFLDGAYQIDLPREEITVKVVSVEDSFKETYEKFIDYYEAENWEVIEEKEVLKDVPEQLESFSRYMERLKVAELEKDNQKMGVAVTKYRDETVGIVWYSPDENAEIADPETTRPVTDGEKGVEDIPEEVRGTNPEDVPLYPDSIRTAHRKLTEQEIIYHEVSYLAETDKDSVVDFFEEGLKEEGWTVLKKIEKDRERGLIAAKERDEIQIRIKTNDDYTGYTEFDIHAKYHSED